MNVIRIFGTAMIALAEIATQASAGDRMVVQDFYLIYDLSESSGIPKPDRTILPEDHILLATLLMEHPAVDTIVLSGDGGLNWPAEEMARKIEAFGLNTIAKNVCASACATILLAGRERSMQAGARVGFHRASNDADYLRELYIETKEQRGWIDEFAFATHVFERAQISARNQIEYMIRRGVSADFALRTLTYGSMDMWFPTEAELLESGVLTRQPKTQQEEDETP